MCAGPLRRGSILETRAQLRTLSSALHFESGPRRLWIKLIAPMLVVLLIGAILHVHPNGLHGQVCILCISARASTPTALFAPPVVLVAIASVTLNDSVKSPASGPEFPSFIRPSPAV